MPNFAQEFPLLLFMPIIIFTATASCVGVIHLTLTINAIWNLRRTPGLTLRKSFAAAAAALPHSFEPHHLRAAHAANADPQLVSTKA